MKLNQLNIRLLKMKLCKCLKRVDAWVCFLCGRIMNFEIPVQILKLCSYFNKLIIATREGMIFMQSCLSFL